MIDDHQFIVMPVLQLPLQSNIPTLRVGPIPPAAMTFECPHSDTRAYCVVKYDFKIKIKYSHLP
jgi:hypothetical protein